MAELKSNFFVKVEETYKNLWHLCHEDRRVVVPYCVLLEAKVNIYCLIFIFFFFVFYLILELTMYEGDKYLKSRRNLDHLQVTKRENGIQTRISCVTNYNLFKKFHVKWYQKFRVLPL